MIGFWKTDQNVMLAIGQLAIALSSLAQLIATHTPYPCTVAIPGLTDWSAFLEWILLTM